MKQSIRMYTDASGYEAIRVLTEDGTCWCDNSDDYIPTSEPLTVEWNLLPTEDITIKQINALERNKSAAYAKWLTIAATFDDKIAKLRAIPHLEEQS